MLKFNVAQTSTYGNLKLRKGNSRQRGMNEWLKGKTFALANCVFLIFLMLEAVI